MSKDFWIDYRSHRYVGEGPKKCPLCHHAISTDQPSSHAVVGTQAEFTFVCPNCGHVFIAYYLLGPNIASTVPSTLRQLILRYTSPQEPEPPQIPESVAAMSPLFAQTYKESRAAQDLSLSQICGPGYRKAFEFLVKDYAKSKASSEEEKTKIEGTFSGEVVTKLIPDPRVSALAKRALWLGNDETHYLRKWGDKDIEDLVTLIELTVRWIEMEHLSERYISDMPDQKSN